MDKRYKVIISNKNIYKEVELTSNARDIKVGTGINCDIRLHKELFFEPIELHFIANAGNWSVFTSDNLYFSLGDSRKLMTCNLSHGNVYDVKYQESNNTAISIEFLIDFDYVQKEYNVKIDISTKQTITIGGSPNCDIVLNDEYIKNDLFSIEVLKTEVIIKDNKSTYGVYVNGNRVSTDYKLKEYDFVSFGSHSFQYANFCLYTCFQDCKIKHLNYVESSESDGHYKYPKFVRNPRIKHSVSDDKITILDPPSEPKKPEGNIVMQLLPAIAMLAVTILLRGIMGGSNISFVLFSACSMGIGIITSVVGIVNDRKKYTKEKGERIIEYNEYIEKKKKQIANYRNKEKEILNKTYISHEEEYKIVENFSGGLFDRDINDKDFAEIRLGTGTIESTQKIDYKKQEKLSIKDELTLVPETVSKEFKYLSDAPVTLNLCQYSAIGVTASKEQQYSVAKNIILDLAIRHYFAELKLCLLIDDDEIGKYHWMRLLPHFRNQSLDMRSIACDDSSKNTMFEFMFKELNRRTSEKMKYPHVVIFVMSDRGIKRHPLSRFIETAKEIGVTFIFFEEDKCHLPKECDALVSVSGNQGELVISEKGEKKQDFTFNEIDDAIARKIVDKLAPVYCEEVTLEGSLTKNITLYELLNIYDAEDIDLQSNWANSEIYKSMAAPIGVKSKNQIVSLDLNEKHHGPHGLVAGTTGSGKSEILQSYILSMATMFHPYEVGFVIIDFKGGGMVNQFKNLPHLVGAITNIDGREINRSLLSIKAELRKRQTIFAEYDVNHIDAYIRKFKAGEAKIPLPHLILIVDEFAELKMDQPEFMKELISAARIGRSLGVHLILATQKPSGVVDAQIWSNSKFKLCLKVQNKEDSNEVLKTPLAAEIKEPGRAYLQVGNNEIFELFQSAYSGAPASMSDEHEMKKYTIYEVSMSGKKKVVYSQKPKKSKDEQLTQLKALVIYIKGYCDENSIEKLPGICLPPLPELIEYSSKSYNKPEGVSVAMGIYDDPNNQLQASFNMDISLGHAVIVGSSQSGKTSILQLILRGIAENYAPSEALVYILDFASKALSVFSSMNHVGGVVLPSEDEKLKNLIRMLKKEIAVRKDVFAQLGITSFNSYKVAGYTDKPHIVVMIDNFVALRELYSEYDEDILHLCREGSSLGITLVITALQTNPIGYKFLSNFVSRYCMFCNDSGEYSNLFDRCKMEPKHVAGRGLMVSDKEIFEFQSFAAFEGEKEIEKVANIKTFLKTINSKYGDEMARRIPEIPNILTPQYIVENVITADQKFRTYCVPISMDYENVELQTIDLVRIGAFSIIGREKSGKTNIVRAIINTLQNRVLTEPADVYIYDNYERQLSEFEEYGVVSHYTTDVSEVETRFDALATLLEERKEQVAIHGLQALDNASLVLVVIKNEDFFNGGISKQAVETFKKIVKMIKMLKVCFIFEDVENVNIGFGASDILKFIKENKNVFFMDDIANIKFMDVSVTVARQFKKPIEVGDGYWISDKGIQKIKTMFAERRD